MTKPKTATKTAAEKRAAREAAAASRAANSDAGTPSGFGAPAGKGTQVDTPPPSNPPALERGAGDRDEKEPLGEDTIRQNTDKARWVYGTDANPKELMEEQNEITEASK